MPKAKRLPSGKYRTVVYIGTGSDGKKKYKSFTDADKNRCELEASQYAERIRYVRSGDSLGCAIEDFIASRKAVLSPATIRGYTNIKNYLEKSQNALYTASIVSLDRETLQNLVTDMVMDGASAKTISNRMSLINTVLKEKGILVPFIRLPERKKPDLTIPDTKDVQNIIAKAKGTEMEIPILLAAFAPLRRSEIVALQMSDIDGNVIHVQRAVVMNENTENVTKTTKTYDSNRFIPMEKSIIDKIREQGYVTKIDNPQIISQRFEHIAKQAGCPGVRFHDLRHWCASYLHAQGVPDQYIMSRGGWKTDKVMKEVYRHELSSEKNKWNQAINKQFKSVLE